MTIIGRRVSQGWGEYSISCSTDCTSGAYTGEVTVTPSDEMGALAGLSATEESLDGITLTVVETADSNASLSVSVDPDACDVSPQQTAQIELTFESGTTETFGLKLLSAFPLACLHDIFSNNYSEQLVTKIHNRYECPRPKGSLFSFMQDCEWLLSFEETTTLMNVCAGYNEGYRAELNKTANRFFKNMLLHQKKYAINTQEEYKRYLDAFNSQPNLCEIDRQAVKKHYLSEWREWDGEPPTSPKMFGFPATSPDAEITDPGFIEWAVDATLDEEIESVQSRLHPDEPRHSSDEYQSLKEQAQEGRPVQRADAWAVILNDAALQGRQEFEFVLGNFFYWQAIHQHYSEFSRKDRVFGAAALLLSRTNVPVLRQKANCNQHIERAHQLRLESEYGEALYHAQKALEIAKNKPGKWETTIENLAARAHRDTALLQRNILLNEDAYDGALTKLDDAREAIIEYEELSSRFKASLIHHIDANRYEVVALRSEEQEDLMEAKRYFERAFHHFDECNQSNRKEIVNYRLDRLIDRICEEEDEDAFKERDRRQSRPGEEESSRDPTFRRKIIDAYNGACAFCGARRKTPDGRFEVHAAHIQSVSDDGPDLMQNGVALCRLHHWAFDNGWIAIDTDYTLRVANHSDTDGYEEFVELDGRDIRPPAEEYQKPGTDFIQYHLKEHGFVEEVTIEAYPDDMTEEELADATSAEMTEDVDVDQNTEAVSNYSRIISEGDIVGSKNNLITGYR